MANSDSSSAEQKVSIELDDRKPAKKSGCGVWGYVIGILIILVAAGGAFKHLENKRAAEEAKKKQERALGYKTQQSNAANDVGMAMSLANSGDIKGALGNLEKAQGKYKTIASTAAQQKDEEAGSEALGKAAAVGAVIEALKGKQEELETLAKEQIGTLPGATKLPAGSEPAATGTDQPAAAEPPAATGEQPTAAPETPAAPAETAPATPPAGENPPPPAPSGG